MVSSTAWAANTAKEQAAQREQAITDLEGVLRPLVGDAHRLADQAEATTDPAESARLIEEASAIYYSVADAIQNANLGLATKYGVSGKVAYQQAVMFHEKVVAAARGNGAKMSIAATIGDVSGVTAEKRTEIVAGKPALRGLARGGGLESQTTDSGMAKVAKTDAPAPAESVAKGASGVKLTGEFLMIIRGLRPTGGFTGLFRKGGRWGHLFHRRAAP